MTINSGFSVFRDPRLRPHAKSAITAGAAIAIVAAGLLSFDVPEVMAQGGFFEALFGQGEHNVSHQYVVEPLRYFSGSRHVWRGRHYGHRSLSRRYAHGVKHARRARRLIAERHSPAPRARRMEAFPAPARTETRRDNPATGRRTVCVRACDGYFFPAGNLTRNTEIGSQQAACDTACPEAETKLFIMRAGSDNIDEAVAARDGEAYSRFIAKLDTNAANSKTCGCRLTMGDPRESTAVFNDPTLRKGDSVVTDGGVFVFKGGALPYKSSDFLSLAETHDLTAEKRAALAAIDRALKTPRGRAALLSERLRQKHSRQHIRSDNSDGRRI